MPRGISQGSNHNSGNVLSLTRKLLYRWEAGAESNANWRFPTACITLDLEADYVTDEFYALEHIPRLTEFCSSTSVPLTVFVEGRVLRNYEEVLSEFPKGTDFGLHCNNHRHIPDTPHSLVSGIRSFFAVFGHAPHSYRAGNYLVTPELMDTLVREGFLYDSSFVPSPIARIQPGVPINRPFRLRNHLWELPVSVWPGLRLPLTMSLVSFIGWPMVRLLVELCGLPEILIFVVHMNDLFRSPALRHAALIRQIGHTWNYRLGFKDPFYRFTRFVHLLELKGYRFTTCSRVVEEAIAVPK
jgi:hypothetical protein